MTTKVEKSVEVEVPVRTAYNQWTQFEEFPEFMGGVQEVVQVDDTSAALGRRDRRRAAGVGRRDPRAGPDEKVAWAAIGGATNAGAVYFAPAGPDRTVVTLHLEYEPEGLVESAGDALGIVERQAEADVRRFKEFIESRGTETGAWRGEVNDDLPVGTPGVEDAALSEGDSGKAGRVRQGRRRRCRGRRGRRGRGGGHGAGGSGDEDGADRHGPGRRRRAHDRPRRGDRAHRRDLGRPRTPSSGATWPTR